MTANDLRVVTALGAVGLILSLPLMWLFGESGLEYAFAGGTAWPGRIAPILASVAALAGIVHAVTLRGGTPVAVLAGAGVGALFALIGRFAEPDLGVGVLAAFGGFGLLAAGAAATLREKLESVGVASAAAAFLAYQVVGPRDWGWIVGAAIVLIASVRRSTYED